MQWIDIYGWIFSMATAKIVTMVTKCYLNKKETHMNVLFISYKLMMGNENSEIIYIEKLISIRLKNIFE